MSEAEALIKPEKGCGAGGGLGPWSHSQMLSVTCSVQQGPVVAEVLPEDL